MRRPRPGWFERRRALLVRLDRSARDLNPLLLVIALGLAVLDISCFAALKLHRFSAPHASQSRHGELGLPSPLLLSQARLPQS